MTKQTLKKIVDFTIAVLTIVAGFLGGATTAHAASLLALY